MSLINQMLRDLEERQATPAAAFEAALQTPVVMASPKRRDRRKLRYVLSASAGVGIALLAWQWLAADSGSPTITAPPPANPVSDSGNIEQSVPALVATANSAVPAEEPAMPTPAVHAVAVAADPAPAAKPQAQVKPLPVASAPQVAAKAAPTPRPVAAAAPDTTSASASNPRPVRQAEAAQPAPVKAPPRLSGPRHIEITEHPLTATQQAQRHYNEAVKALRAGDTGTSLQQLEQALTLDNGLHHARLVLASLYINQQRKQQAETLLAEGLTLNPRHAPFAKLHAQLLVEQTREQEAIQSLQSALPGAGQDAEYHALLGGLYQRNGEPGTAAGHYRTALQYAPGHGEWWLGLGLSLEQAGNSAEARAAYGQALKLPLDSALQNYVGTRMKRLSRNPQPGA
ncbi:MAG: tetratricopeptide repeat protein [Gammaproteobacteria bacterium]|nr:tetratricopeptide repeat protein [Gammaproteobacteria bacterium]